MPYDIASLALTRCEQCKRNTAAVVESRRLSGYVRRRKECRHCQHRFTDYELSAAEFERLTSAAHALAAVRKALGTEQATTTASLDLPCDRCQFKTRRGCSFDYPEFGTPDAADCLDFKAA